MGQLQVFKFDISSLQLGKDITFELCSSSAAESSSVDDFEPEEGNHPLLRKDGPDSSKLINGGPALLLAICNEADAKKPEGGCGPILQFLVLKPVAMDMAAYERVGNLILFGDGKLEQWLAEAHESMTVTIV